LYFVKRFFKQNSVIFPKMKDFGSSQIFWLPPIFGLATPLLSTKYHAVDKEVFIDARPPNFCYHQLHVHGRKLCTPDAKQQPPLNLHARFVCQRCRGEKVQE